MPHATTAPVPLLRTRAIGAGHLRAFLAVARHLNFRAAADELSLTPAQRAVIDSAWDWRRERSREVMAGVRPALDSIRDSARVRMMSVMDSTQRDAFRNMIERNRRTMDSAARARGESR